VESRRIPFERGEEKMNRAVFWMGERGSEGDAICTSERPMLRREEKERRNSERSPGVVWVFCNQG